MRRVSLDTPNIRSCDAAVLILDVPLTAPVRRAHGVLLLQGQSPVPLQAATALHQRMVGQANCRVSEVFVIVAHLGSCRTQQSKDCAMLINDADIRKGGKRGWPGG
jgi:endonuclease/exonuclease/phosphatase family metal-dependent hydrolase